MEIPPSEFCRISANRGKLGIPNLARMSLMKSYLMLQNARFTVLGVVKNIPLLPRLNCFQRNVCFVLSICYLTLFFWRFYLLFPPMGFFLLIDQFLISYLILKNFFTSPLNSSQNICTETFLIFQNFTQENLFACNLFVFIKIP